MSDELTEALAKYFSLVIQKARIDKGGPGSGNWGHAGRPGIRGGSVSAATARSIRTGATGGIRQQIAKNPGRDVAVIRTGGGGRISIETPYDADFVSDLKNNIAPPMRKWDSGKKQWEIDASARKVVDDLTNKYFHTLDGDKMTSGHIKQAKDAVHIARIKNNKKIIASKRGQIESKIDDLDDQISRYSYGSRSRVKGDLIRKRALFTHVLNDLDVKPAKMEDIQVRGLAAAIRELGG